MCSAGVSTPLGNYRLVPLVSGKRSGEGTYSTVIVISVEFVYDCISVARNTTYGCCSLPYCGLLSRAQRINIVSSTTVRLNIRETDFTRGDLAKLAWVARSFDDQGDRRAYLPDREFKSYAWGEAPGDQLTARVVFETDKFVYIAPVDSDAKTMTVEPKQAASKREPKPTLVKDSGYGEYVSPSSSIIGDMPDDVTLFIDELERANSIIDRTTTYYRENVTKIALRYRSAKLQLSARMSKWDANLRVIRGMGGTELMLEDLEDRLSADGRLMKSLEDRMMGEIHHMEWLFIAREDVRGDLEHLFFAEGHFSTTEFETRTAQSYPFILWMYSTGKYHESMAEGAWKFLTLLEEKTVETALGQKSL